MPIISIAIDDEYTYTLDDAGEIRRSLLITDLSDDPIAGPPGTHAQLMTTNTYLYVRNDDGSVYRRYEHNGSWEPVTVPAGVTWISSDDKNIILVAGDVVYRSSFLGDVFHPIASVNQPSGIVQIDHDEEFSYTLTGTGEIWLRKINGGDYFQYEEPLADVTHLCAGIEFIYAVAAGIIYRSKTFGRSGWEPLGTVAGAQTIAVPSTHRDEIWYAVGDDVGSAGKYTWVGAPPPEIYWVVNGWADSDWVKTEP